MKRSVFSLLALLIALSSFGQRDSAAEYIYNHPKQITQATIINGDTVPWVILDEVLLIAEPTFSDEEARKRYFILKRKVMRVYPYAVLAGDKLDSLNLRLDTIDSRRQRNRYIKDYQEFLENRFEPELRKLTRSEGQILCKLIYRETGMTVYELISEYRSGWTAFWWNASAYWYDISLKTEYDPEQIDEDKLIELILRRAFLEGLLKERVPFYPPSSTSAQ